MLTKGRAIVSEFLGRLGIDYAFRKKDNFAFILAYASELLFKGNRRGSLLLTYLYLRNDKKDRAFKIFSDYEKKVPLLMNLAMAMERYKTKNEFLSPRIYSLAQTWSKNIPIPRQIQSFRK